MPRVDARQRRRHVEPERERFAGGAARHPRRGVKRAAGAGINRRAIRVVQAICARGLRDVVPRTETGIEKPPRLHIRGNGSVTFELRALAQHRLLPIEAKPFKILKAGGDAILGAANGVDIFDPDKKASSHLARQTRIQQRGIGVAEMQEPVGAGRETENGLHGRMIRVAAGHRFGFHCH